MNLYYSKLCFTTQFQTEQAILLIICHFPVKRKLEDYFRNVSKFAIILGTIYVLTQKLLLAREYAILSKC